MYKMPCTTPTSLATTGCPATCSGMPTKHKTIRDEFRIKRGETLSGSSGEAESLPYGVGTLHVPAAQSAAPADDEDPELSAYNAYLTRLNAEVKNHGRWHGLR